MVAQRGYWITWSWSCNTGSLWATDVCAGNWTLVLWKCRKVLNHQAFSSPKPNSFHEWTWHEQSRFVELFTRSTAICCWLPTEVPFTNSVPTPTVCSSQTMDVCFHLQLKAFSRWVLRFRLRDSVLQLLFPSSCPSWKRHHQRLIRRNLLYSTVHCLKSVCMVRLRLNPRQERMLA